MAALAWRSAGGAGEPPEDLTLAFALHLSAHTTQALMADFNRTPAQIGALTADILKTLLHRAVEAHRSAGDDRATDVVERVDRANAAKVGPGPPFRGQGRTRARG